MSDESPTAGPVDIVGPVDKLALALSKAQAAMQAASKDATNPHFKATYTTLSACWDACRKPLSDNGLAIIQVPRTDSNVVTVRTILTHSSGALIQGDLSVTNLNTRNPSQGIGSCITYLRRYALCSFVGISPEDDDGEATGNTNADPKPKTVEPPPRNGPSEAQLRRLYALTHKSPWTEDDVKEIMKKRFNVLSSLDLNREQYNQLCDALIKETMAAEGGS